MLELNKLFFPKNTSVELTAKNSINLRYKLAATGKYKVKGLGISCSLKDWNQEDQRVRRSNPNYSKHNNQLKFIEDELKAIKRKRNITASDIDLIVKASIKEVSVEKLLNSEQLLLNMVKSYHSYIETTKNSPNTQRRVKSVERTLIDFEDSVNYKITADSLNESMYKIKEDIERYFHERGRKSSTIKAFFTYLNASINRFNKHSPLKARTFDKKIENEEKEERDVIALTKGELKKLYDFVFHPDPKRLLKPKPTELRNLKFFLFRCFCGMRISDMTSENINPETLKKDSKTFTYFQKKGKKAATVSCIGTYLYDIAESLNWKFPNKKRLISTASYSYGETLHVRLYLNRILVNEMRKIQHTTNKGITYKNIADEITTHTARKTYAHLLYEITKDLVRVKEELGHKNIKTTELYLKHTFTNENSNLKDIVAF